MPTAARTPQHELRFTHVASAARIAWARAGPAFGTAWGLAAEGAAVMT
jgi:hypothetical protein